MKSSNPISTRARLGLAALVASIAIAPLAA